MPIARGSRIGRYEIIGSLGAGGMGEVYRARDTTLNRDVAIKVLPTFFANDPERLARFGREAQLLASLNHPNIAHVHGFETAPDGDPPGALVMELVDGPTLAERLRGGRLPLDEALPIAQQIADALEAAHAQGIIHRDLKPANVKVRADGTVKVLDFGLAKLASPDGSGQDTALANSPTFTAHSTELGLVLGTAAYMAPEQARGRVVDKRADIWAFGVVLFEMLAGKQLFDGESTSEVLAGVLKEQPDWNALPADTPASIRRLLSRCLDKDPKRRLRDIGDARLELDDVGGEATVPAAAPRARVLWPVAAAVLAGAAVTAVVFLLALPRLRSAPAPLERVSVLPPPGTRLFMDAADSAISPNGRLLVFRTGAKGQPTQIWVRPLDSQTPRLLPTGLTPHLPFWSPDSTRVGFFDEGKLKTIAIDSGAVTVVCNAPDGRGGAWSPSGVIVFSPSNSVALMRVSAEGGDPQPLTTLDTARQETAHRFPSFLPDGRHFLFTALAARDRFDIFAGSLDGPERKLVATALSGAVYADPGYLLFMRQNGLAAQRFDAAKLTTAGEAMALPDAPIAVGAEWLGGPPVTVSATGIMSYLGGPGRDSKLIWIDLTTDREVGSVTVPPGYYERISIAKDGKHAAVSRADSPVEADIWIVDLDRGGATRLTNGPGANRQPLWSPDGARIAYVSDRSGIAEFFARPANGGAEETLLTKGGLFKEIDAWAPDGQSILYSQLDPATQRDLWILPLGGDRTPRPYIKTAFNEYFARLSPDGRWASYIARESAAADMYVQSYPVPREKYRITTGGVSFGGFLPNGRIGYAVPGDPHFYVVDVQTTPSFSTGVPRAVLTLPSDLVAGDILPDSSKLLASVPAERTSPASVTLVLNWALALQKR